TSATRGGRECQGDRGGSGSRPELAGARKRRHQDAQGLRSASPKVLEPVGCHLGVSDRVLDVLVPEVVLESPCVVAITGEHGAACGGGWGKASWKSRRRAG